MRKFIVALCPATPVYLCATPDEFRVAQPTTVKADAFQFDTFDLAMAALLAVQGWGGACRVEEIEIEVPPAVTVTAERIEALLDRTDLCSYTTPLTTEQRAAARAQIIDAINLLLYHNLDSIASAALLDARNA